MQTAKIPDFSKYRVMVVGESCVDRYTVGRSTRGSEEDPQVPVVTSLKTSKELPGMCANVVQNLRALGAQAELFTPFSYTSQTSRLLARLLGGSGLVTSVYPTATAVKERLMVNGRHIARLDREKRLRLSPASEADALSAMTARLDEFSGVVLQDYGKGLWTDTLLGAFVDRCRSRGVPVFVDPYRGKAPEAYAGCHLIKPNSVEAFDMTGCTPSIAAGEIRARTRAEYCVVTCGGEGMHVATTQSDFRVNTLQVEPVDVAGAGDSALAVLTLCELAGWSIAGAARMANRASRLTVQRLGVYAPTAREVFGGDACDE